jgi:hypothetical protein
LRESDEGSLRRPATLTLQAQQRSGGTQMIVGLDLARETFGRNTSNLPGSNDD